MRHAAAALVVCLAALPACGSQAQTDPTGCGTTTMTNCPQDTLPTTPECPLPPIPGAQGFYTVGCTAMAQCGRDRVTCTCGDAGAGPEWTCAVQ